MHKIMQELYSNGVGDHSGQRGTIKRVEEFFFWLSMHKEVAEEVRNFLTCQRHKAKHVQYPGLL